MRQREWVRQVQREHTYTFGWVPGRIIVCACGDSFDGFLAWSRHLMALEAERPASPPTEKD